MDSSSTSLDSAWRDLLSTTFLRSYTFSWVDLCLVLAASFLLSLMIAYAYRASHRGPSYSQAFVINIPIISMVVACIMLIVGSNIAGAVTLLGALSVVRFRNAIKDTRDVTFLFFCMAVGIACGTRFYLMAVIMTLFICGVIWVLTRLKFGAKRVEEDFLKLAVPEDLDYSAVLEGIFKKFLRRYSLVSIHSEGGGRRMLSYSVSLRSPELRDQLVKELLPVAADQEVLLIRGDHLVEL
jgi:hypothetical protein